MGFSTRVRAAVAWRWWWLRTPFGCGVLRRLHHLPSTFSTAHDCWSYTRAVLATRADLPPVAIAVKGLGGRTVLCRPGTSDPWVLWDTFHLQYQRAPQAVEDPRFILDLGANVGYTAAYFAAQYPDARIVAVEMDARNYELACQNLQQFGERCTVLQAAIWDRDGEMEYEGTEEQGYRVSPDARTAGESGRRRVRTRSIGSLLDELGWTEVDFVKMDIEGAEAAVFGGQVDWLQRVRALKIEWHPPATYEGCRSLLANAGFACRPDERHDHAIVALRPPRAVARDESPR